MKQYFSDNSICYTNLVHTATAGNHKRIALSVTTDKVPLVSLTATVADIEKVLDTEKIDQFETINYIYILGADRKLKGIASIKEIFRNPKNTVISKIMETNLITLRAHSPQEKAAMLAIKHNIKAVPVVDPEDRFLGVIPSDKILEILHREHVEDVLYEVGVGRFTNPVVELIHASALEHIQKRLPWLIVGLLGGILAAYIVSGFDHLVEELILLAAFLPAIVYIGDAVGAQAQTIMIRSLAIDKDLPIGNYALREVVVNSFMGLIIGAFAGIASQIFWGNIVLAFIVSTSFLLTILLSSVIAILLPLIFEKVKVDPAIGSGPIATVVRDILSILIYFTVASIFLGWV